MKNTEKSIKQIIDKSLVEYNKLWNTLLSLLGKGNKGIKPTQIKNFQIILGETLYALSKKYKSIAQEKRVIVQNKGKYSRNYFINRLKKLKDYQLLINEYILMGKSIGDIYVWIFYERDKQIIKNHMNHPEQFHFPTGIGGVGEVELIRNAPIIKNHLLLLHSLTNILHIADVSLFSLDTKKISVLGEIKTKEIEPQLLSISINMVGVKTSVDSFANEIINLKIPKPTKDTLGIVEQKISERLKRQLNVMIKFWKEKDESEVRKKIIEFATIIDFNFFEEALLNTKINKFQHFQYDDGILLSVYKMKKSSSFNYINSQQTAIGGNKDDLIKKAKQILLPNSKFNKFFISSFFYKNDKELNWLSWMSPLFWFPIKHELLKSIYFREFLIIVTLNPASIINKLEQNGFTINIKNSLFNFSVSKKIGTKNFEIPNFSIYLRLLALHLVKENAVIQLLNEITHLKLPKNQRIQIFPELNFIF